MSQEGAHRVFKSPYVVQLNGLENNDVFCQGVRGCESIEEVAGGVRVTWRREENGRVLRRSATFLQGILDTGWEEERDDPVLELAAQVEEDFETLPKPKKTAKKRAKSSKKGGGDAPENAQR